MTPKEKAKELVDKFKLMAEIIHIDEPFEETESGVKIKNAKIVLSSKKCASIAVDEALNVFIQLHSKLVLAGVIQGKIEDTETYKFWQEVKQEINKL